MKKYVLFPRSEEVDTEKMITQVNQLESSVRKLAACYEWSKEIEEFVISLVEGQIDWEAGAKAKNRQMKHYRAWVVSPTHDMPSDARVDFAFIPTTLACAALMIYRQRWPDKAAAIDHFDRTLADGLLFSTLRRFQGHGIEGNDGVLRTMNIFALADVVHFVETNPSLCIPFTRLVNAVVAEMKKGANSAYAQGGWGMDCTDKVHECLKALGIKAPGTDA